MFTLIESPIFTEERRQFAAWQAENADAGTVVPGSGGVRKVRWSRPGQGKRGGVRVIYYNQLGESLIWLLKIYAKSSKENAPSHILRALKEELIDDHECKRTC